MSHHTLVHPIGEKEVYAQTLAFALHFFQDPPFQVLLPTMPTLGILSKNEDEGWWHILVDARPQVPEPYSFLVTRRTKDQEEDFQVTPKGFWLIGLGHNQAPETL